MLRSCSTSKTPMTEREPDPLYPRHLILAVEQALSSSKTGSANIGITENDADPLIACQLINRIRSGRLL
jgi:hypothetical protein